MQIMRLIPCLLWVSLAAGPALAQFPQIRIAQDQQYMLEAAQRVIARDFEAALGLYNQALAVNGANVQAYIQRAVVRRELRDDAGLRQDATTALQLAEANMRRNPADPNAYYQRGTALRLLKDFANARQNIEYAMRMEGGQQDWAADLQAIALEEKMAP